MSYTASESICRGCMGPCGLCGENEGELSAILTKMDEGKLISQLKSLIQGANRLIESPFIASDVEVIMSNINAIVAELKRREIP